MAISVGRPLGNSSWDNHPISQTVVPPNLSGAEKGKRTQIWTGTNCPCESQSDFEDVWRSAGILIHSLWCLGCQISYSMTRQIWTSENKESFVQGGPQYLEHFLFLYFFSFAQNLFIVYQKFKLSLESCIFICEVWRPYFMENDFNVLLRDCLLCSVPPAQQSEEAQTRKLIPALSLVPTPTGLTPWVAQECCILQMHTCMHSHANTLTHITHFKWTYAKVHICPGTTNFTYSPPPQLQVSWLSKHKLLPFSFL